MDPWMGQGQYSAGSVSPPNTTGWGAGTGYGTSAGANTAVSGRDVSETNVGLANNNAPTAGLLPYEQSPEYRRNQNIAAQTAADARYTAPAFDEAAIRRQYEQDLQRQVDAIKGNYVAPIQREQVAGEGRIGQQRGLSSVSGTRYSARGAAEQAAVERVNQGALDAINAQMRYEIAQATAASRGLQVQDISQQRQDAMTAARDAASNYFQQAGLDANAANSAADRAMAQAIAMGQIDGTNTMEMNRYLADRAQNEAENARADAQLKLDQEAAKKKGYQLINADDGSIVAVNPSDPTDTYVVGRYAAPKSSGGGGGGSTPYPANADGSPSEESLALVEGVDYGTIPYSSLTDGQKQSYLSAKAYIARQNAAPSAETTPAAQAGPQAPAGSSIPSWMTTSRYGGPQVPIFGQIGDIGNAALDWIYGK